MSPLLARGLIGTAEDSLSGIGVSLSSCRASSLRITPRVVPLVSPLHNKTATLPAPIANTVPSIPLLSTTRGRAKSRGGKHADVRGVPPDVAVRPLDVWTWHPAGVVC